MISVFKSIFTGELKYILKKTRKSERKKGKKERRKAVKRATIDVENFYKIKLQEKNLEMESLKIKISELERKERKMKNKWHEIREINVLQRRVASDLVYLQKERQTENIEYFQKFTSLVTQLDYIEKKMIGLDK
jgi:hypothetical protein